MDINSSYDKISHDYSFNNSDDTDLAILLPILVTFIAIIMTTAMAGNLYIFYAIYRCRSLHKTSSFLIANLAVADILTAIIVLPPMAYSAIQGKMLFNDTFCQISAYINYIIFGASLNTSITITMDRFVAVLWPFRYERITTPSRTAFMISTSWLFPSIVAMLPLLSLQRYGLGRYRYTNSTYYCGIDLHDYQDNYLFNVISAASILNSVAVVAIAYLFIFRVAYKKWVKSQQKSIDIKGNKEASLLRTVRTTALIVGTNILCWLPAVIQVLIYTINPPNQLANKVDVLGIIFVWLPYTNCAVNPIIYISSNSRLRNLVIKQWEYYRRNIMCFKFCHPRNKNVIGPWLTSEPSNSFHL
ncbi:uncharacterized protein TRIADDRAFT_25957 [Trichoplax adhaerens]|uniref:G-protein coupled receptors family 1 profile domain-containing protein n=1 Tax=Trichoplax adhaerens TaxID=10228 RepID=B3RX97_TRIAD|nr:hypothetical protein TRIADDRAFT_25957 [Trichoplax adhaerens]EDV24833.1 hypothetical protein TRIADDRAFT_25957 [Trichoplax adhaerens]|eukprot:XP_002112723.1 hypothetical protein TRIADDRAFT_25957 [Trichoplax adhaerens]